jgi:hypothetical protein
LTKLSRLAGAAQLNPDGRTADGFVLLSIKFHIALPAARLALVAPDGNDKTENSVEQTTRHPVQIGRVTFWASSTDSLNMSARIRKFKHNQHPPVID